MNRDAIGWRTAFEIGSRSWASLYGDNRHDDARAIEATIAHLTASAEAGLTDPRAVVQVHKTDAVPAFNAFDPTIMRTAVASAKWVDGGCRTIRADASYFAAMAQTRITESISEEMRIPYPCFVVELPDGLLVGEDGRAYEMAMFCQFTNIKVGTEDFSTLRLVPSASYYAIYADDGTTLHSFFPEHSLADHLFEPRPDFGPSSFENVHTDVPESAGDARIREMVCSATAGLLYTMQHTRNWRHGGHFDRASGSSRDRHAPPPHRTILVGAPIKIDVSAAVSADARSGEHSAPSVQTLVRGHLKRQVIGAGRASRKIIWVEPYWRGPEGAPILMRPYTVSSPLPANTKKNA